MGRNKIAPWSRFALAMTLAAAVFCLGCSESESPPAPPTSPAAPSDPSTPEPSGTATGPESEGVVVPEMPPAGNQAATEVDPFAVPEGPLDEVFGFLYRLNDKQPAGSDQASLKAFWTNKGGAYLTAADRILAAEPNPGQAKMAVQAKLAGLTMLERSGDETVAAKRDAIPAELEAVGLGDLAYLIDADTLLQRYIELDPVKADVLAFADDLAAHLEKNPPGADEAGWAMETLRGVKQLGDPEEVAAMHERFSKIFATSPDDRVVRAGAKLAGVARRINLVGNEMPLEGTTLEGEPLDWSNYEGKVVLVDFWATRCGPCIAEMANIHANYEKYHDRGFEVIGISTDDNRGTLRGFKMENDVPWTIVVDQDRMDADQEPMSLRYGVESIPTVMLIGKDGKVISTEVHGPELGRRLEELLGPTDTVEETAADES